MTGRAKGGGHRGHPSSSSSARHQDPTKSNRRSSKIRAASSHPSKRIRTSAPSRNDDDEPQEEEYQDMIPSLSDSSGEEARSDESPVFYSSESDRPQSSKSRRSSKSDKGSRSHRSSHSHRDSKTRPSSRSHRNTGRKRHRSPTDSEEGSSTNPQGLSGFASIARVYKDESSRISQHMVAGREWMLSEKPVVTKEHFRSLAPMASCDNTFTKEDSEAVIRSFEADPAKRLILGQHTVEHIAVEGRVPPKKPRRAERDSFGTVFRLFLRYYDCTYDQFMGPKYQLRLDCSENPLVTIDDGTRINDPFPSKPFSEGLRCLISQNIWLGNLELLATCIQYINRVRTHDTRPWKLVDCDPESMFFKTWISVVARNPGQATMEDLYSQVKRELGPQKGFYQTFFDQITKSVESKIPQGRAARVYKSRRRDDQDPYFIRAIDMAILLDALDNMSFWGFPLFRSTKLTSAIIQRVKPGQDYPSEEKLSKARYYSVLSERTFHRAAELRAEAEKPIKLSEGDTDSSSDDPAHTSCRSVDLSNRSPKHAAHRSEVSPDGGSRHVSRYTASSAVSHSSSDSPAKNPTDRDKIAEYTPQPQTRTATKSKKRPRERSPS
ncbi:hypothetical protein F4815DRAFT_489270 [Daldinia loculata]|nr:hypothetical protein F4815DRAFT_489270 [Daldinia loculata]